MEHDVVNKPSHYMLMEGVEVRDVLEVLAEKVNFGCRPRPTAPTHPNMPPLFLSDYVQMMQYLMRFMDKNGREDLMKARWYLDKLIDAYDQ